MNTGTSEFAWNFHGSFSDWACQRIRAHRLLCQLLCLFTFNTATQSTFHFWDSGAEAVTNCIGLRCLPIEGKHIKFIQRFFLCSCSLSYSCGQSHENETCISFSCFFNHCKLSLKYIFWHVSSFI